MLIGTRLSRNMWGGFPTGLKLQWWNCGSVKANHYFCNSWLEIPSSEVVNGVTNGLDFLYLFAWNGGTELFFQFHNQLDNIKRVRSYIFKKRCCGSDPLLVQS